MESLLAVFTWRRWLQILMDRTGWTWTTLSRSDVSVFLRHSSVLPMGFLSISHRTFDAFGEELNSK